MLFKVEDCYVLASSRDILQGAISCKLQNESSFHFLESEKFLLQMGLLVREINARDEIIILVVDMSCRAAPNALNINKDTADSIMHLIKTVESCLAIWDFVRRA